MPCRLSMSWRKVTVVFRTRPPLSYQPLSNSYPVDPCETGYIRSPHLRSQQLLQVAGDLVLFGGPRDALASADRLTSSMSSRPGLPFLLDLIAADISFGVIHALGAHKSGSFPHLRLPVGLPFR